MTYQIICDGPDRFRVRRRARWWKAWEYLAYYKSLDVHYAWYPGIKSDSGVFASVDEARTHAADATRYASLNYDRIVQQWEG